MVRYEQVRTFFHSTESQEAKSEVLSISAICPRACQSRSSDVYKKFCYRPLRELLSSNSDRIQSQNSDLEIPKKEKSEGDHHSTEYFEADDDKDKIKIEKEDSEDKATVGKLGILQLRL